jgi:hypothetical protein
LLSVYFKCDIFYRILAAAYHFDLRVNISQKKPSAMPLIMPEAKNGGAM